MLATQPCLSIPGRRRRAPNESCLRVQAGGLSGDSGAATVARFGVAWQWPRRRAGRRVIGRLQSRFCLFFGLADRRSLVYSSRGVGVSYARRRHF
jgi:hypothetical protein